MQVAAGHRRGVGPGNGVVAGRARVLGPENVGEVRNPVPGLAEGLEERIVGGRERSVADEDLGVLPTRLAAFSTRAYCSGSNPDTGAPFWSI